MPELPEVETYVRALETLLMGKTVLAAEARWPRTIAAPDAALFQDLIRGRRFVSFARRGKYMLFGLDSGETLVVHLRMTGELRIHAPAASESEQAAVPVDKHTHVLFELDTGEELRFRDTRKFGRIWLVEDVSEVVGKLGPEPLSAEFLPQTLAKALDGRKANVKALLLNQTVVAGVGNIYADEYRTMRRRRAEKAVFRSSSRYSAAAASRAFAVMRRSAASCSANAAPISAPPVRVKQER